MKIVIDPDKLLGEGQITRDEYIRLIALAVEETGSLAFNILVGFGVIATAGGALALVPFPSTAIFLGIMLSFVGIFISTNYSKEWGVLGSMLLLVGSLTAAGAILILREGDVIGFGIVAIISLLGAVLAKSALLAAITALALSATVGAMTAYGHASYFLAVRQPAVTVVLFSALAFGAYQLSKTLSLDYQRLAIIFARTSVFIVNFGFWIGSLWGDSLWLQRDEWDYGSGRVIPDWVFSIGWAVALLATGVWAAKNNKRWVVNLLAVFGAIHFYTQYFERLGANPASVLMAGLLALAIAFAIVRYNKKAKPNEP
jgi:iron complex transport system permease protein